MKSKKWIKFLLNKYVVLLLIVVVWMFFFDENSYFVHKEFDKEIDKLNTEKNYYKSQIEADKKTMEQLKNKEDLEKFAREKYHMKKENEAIYLIKYDTLKK